MRYYKKIAAILLSALAFPAIAATNDLVFSENSIVSNVALGSGTTNMLVFASSSAESFDLIGGVLTVTNPGSVFKVGSSEASVGTIVVLKSDIMESCVVNSSPGASSSTLPVSAGVYTIRPLEATSCSSLCPSVSGATAYNAYPTCGAASCDSGYVLSGSGSGAVCAAQSSGGGGGSSYIPPSTDQDNASTSAITTAATTTTITQGSAENIEENNQADSSAELSAREKQFLRIVSDADAVYASGKDLNIILSYNNVPKNAEKQTESMNKYIPKIKEGLQGLTINDIYALNNFIVYGTVSTKILGEGERAGVINSYKKAFGKVPKTQSEWKDCIAIGNGRWPGEKSLGAEANAKKEFKIVYLRDADIKNPHDNAAVTVMAYGLRPDKRNLKSESAGSKIFKNIYKRNPNSAADWDIVRAISYSGAKR